MCGLLLVIVQGFLAVGALWLVFKTCEGLAWFVRHLPVILRVVVVDTAVEIGPRLVPHFPSARRVGRFLLLSSWWWLSLGYTLYACFTQ